MPERLQETTSINELELPEIDFLGPEYLSDPLAACRAAREQAWAARTRHGPLVVTHEDVNELLRYPEDEVETEMCGHPHRLVRRGVDKRTQQE